MASLGLTAGVNAMSKIFSIGASGAILLSLLLLSSCTYSDPRAEEIEKGDNEVIILSYLKIESGSKQKIYNFLENYVGKVILVEPQSYGYGFYEYGDDILFIERFKNEDAIISHAKNVSEGGVLQKYYAEYNGYFEPYKVDVFGEVSQDLIDYLNPYNLPISYYPKIISFSKGYEMKWEQLK